MTTERPKVTDMGRYSITQTAAILKIDRGSLRKYTHDTCEINCYYRTIAGKERKYYLGRDILKFWDGRSGGGVQ